MKTILKIKTWKCECGYSQDYFSEICLACGKNLNEVTNDDEKVEVIIMGEEDILPTDNYEEMVKAIDESIIINTELI